MTWSVLSLALVVSQAPAASRPSAPPPDPALVALAKARAAYAAEIAKVSDAVVKALDEREEALRKANDAAGLELVGADRDALRDRGAWPSTLGNAPIRARWIRARNDLETAYARAENDLFARKKNDLDTAAREERTAFHATTDLAPWRDALADAALGEWTREGTGVVGAAGSAPLSWKRVDSLQYEVEIRAQRLEGGGGLALDLVDSNGEAVRVIVDADDFAKKPARVVARVLLEGITVESDGLTRLRATTGSRSKSVAAESAAPLALSADDKQARFRIDSIRIKSISELRDDLADSPALSPPPKTPAKPPAAAPAQRAVNGWTDAKLHAAADEGLRWLARHQNADGSWSSMLHSARCGGNPRCEGPGEEPHDTGVTGLALLAFFEAGCGEASPRAMLDPHRAEPLRFRETITRALTWLASKQRDDGSFCNAEDQFWKWGYNHSIAAFAMVEAARANPSKWSESARKAIAKLIDGRSRPTDGAARAWRYCANARDRDFSVTGWCAYALAAAESAGIASPREALQNAFDYCVELTNPSTFQVGYVKRSEAGLRVLELGKNAQYSAHPTMAAMAISVRVAARFDPKDPALAGSASLLRFDRPQYDSVRVGNDYYYWHAATRALRSLFGPDGKLARNGEDWLLWTKDAAKAALAGQVRDAKLCRDGAWDPDDRWGFGGGRVYATAMNVMTLGLIGR